MATEMNVEAERAAFEAWAERNAIRTDLGAWDAWFARAAQPADVGAGEVPQVVLDALDIAYDLAVAEADHVHEVYKGYKPHRHAAVDADVQTIKDAQAAVTAALLSEESPQAAQGVMVGTTVAMPGSGGGLTMCAFNASDVPIGTKLYAAPPLSSEQQAEKGAGACGS